MKVSLLALLCLFLSFLVIAQPPDRDKLIHDLMAVKNDSAKAVLLNTIARTYVRNTPDSAIVYFQRAINLSSANNYYLLTTNSLSFLSMTYAIHGKMDSAKLSLLKSATICKENDLDSALYQTYFGLGNVVESLGELATALDYYLRALTYFEQTVQLKSINRTKANMAYIYMKTNDLGKAQKLIIESNIYYDKVGATRQLMNGYSRLSSLYAQTSKIDSSLHFSKKAIHIADSLGDVFAINQLKLDLANTLFNSKKYKEASSNYQKLVPYFETQHSNSGDVLNVFTGLMVSHSALGHTEQSKYYEQKADSMLTKVKEYKHIMDFYYKKFMIDSIKGDSKRSIQNYQKYIALKDSLFNVEKSNQLLTLQTKFETEKIKREKEAAENKAFLAEIESDKNRLLFWGAVSISFLLILAYTFYSTKQKQAKKAEIIKLELKASQKQLALEKQYRDSELKALKAQMNPHFIFNVLNSIQEFIVLNQKELASEYLAMFAELIRSYLHFSNTGVITLKEETDTLTKYLELETLRFEDSFTYDLSIDELIQPEELNIPTMIIQPYVENAIKHGLFHKQNERRLTVDFSVLSSSVLQCVITDNGIGREESKRINSAKKSSGHKSFAMEATANRLELYNQKTSHKIGIETNDLLTDTKEPNGTKVILTIPLI